MRVLNEKEFGKVADPKDIEKAAKKDEPDLHLQALERIEAAIKAQTETIDRMINAMSAEKKPKE